MHSLFLFAARLGLRVLSDAAPHEIGANNHHYLTLVLGRRDENVTLYPLRVNSERLRGFSTACGGPPGSLTRPQHNTREAVHDLAHSFACLTTKEVPTGVDLFAGKV